MSFPHLIRFGVIVPCVALMASFASAQHGGHGGGHGGGGHGGGHMGGAHMGGAHMGGAHVGGVHHTTGFRGTGIGYGGYGLYGLGYGGYGLGYGNYGLGYGGYGLGYGNYGYGLGYGGYGYGYPSYGYSSYPSYGYGSSIGVPAIPGVYSIPPQTFPSQPMTNPANPADPNPIPLPLPNGNTGEPQPGTITVVTDEGASVTFDGIANDQKGTRHTFTTKPIAQGIETRVSVKVDGPNGPSTISIGIRAGEKATVDMRK